MIDAQTFAVFLAGALLLNATPGPDMAFTMATGARGGVRAGLAAAAGVGAGCLGWSALTAAGLAALLAASEHALTVIRVAGGLYLLYLAWNAFKHRRAMPEAGRGGASAAQAFRAGALTNLFNPKVGLFFLAFLPTFADPAAGPVWLQTFMLGAVFSVTGACMLAAVAFAAGTARERLARSVRLRSAVNTGAAGVFAGLGAYLLFSRNH